LRNRAFLNSWRCRLRHRRQIYRRIFAAAIDFEFKLEPVTFVEIGHAGALDGGNVDKSIGLPIIALNEAEALHRVEEFDRPAGFLAGELPLRAATIAAAAGSSAITRRTTILDRKRLAFDLEVGRGNAATAIDEREFERLAFGKPGQTGLLDGGNVDEHVLTAIVAHDETETLLTVEEFDDALAFADYLGRHAAAAGSTATAATETAAAAAEAIAAAETAAAAEAVTAATATATEAIAATAGISAVTLISEAVALILATTLPAAPTFETHAVLIPISPRVPSRLTPGRGARVPLFLAIDDGQTQTIKQKPALGEQFSTGMNNRCTTIDRRLPARHFTEA
jgi:hypothetical protein